MPLLLAPRLTGTGMSPSRDHALLVARGDDAVLVDATGALRSFAMPGGPVVRIAADGSGGALVLGEGEARYVLPADERGVVRSRFKVAGAVDVAVDCDGRGWVATSTGVLSMNLDGGEISPFGAPVPGLLGIRHAGCGALLAWTSDEVWQIDATRAEVLTRPDPPVRSVARRLDGTVYVVHHDERISRVDPDGLAIPAGAAWGEVRDATFGVGGPLRREHLYLLLEDGLVYTKP